MWPTVEGARLVGGPVFGLVASLVAAPAVAPEGGHVLVAGPEGCPVPGWRASTGRSLPCPLCPRAGYGSTCFPAPGPGKVRRTWATVGHGVRPGG